MLLRNGQEKEKNVRWLRVVSYDDNSTVVCQIYRGGRGIRNGHRSEHKHHYIYVQ